MVSFVVWRRALYWYESEESILYMGMNEGCQLGFKGPSFQLTPVMLNSPNEFKWSSFACGFLHSLGITQNGQLYQWGKNCITNTYNTTPIDISDGMKWISVYSGSRHFFTLTENNELYGWVGRLGLGDRTDTSDKFEILCPNGQQWVTVYCGLDYTYGLTTNGQLYSWGWNDQGQLGIGNNTAINSPLLWTTLQLLDTSMKVSKLCEYYSYRFMILSTII